MTNIKSNGKHHWEVYRILKSKLPDLTYKELRKLASAITNCGLDVNSDSDILEAVEQLENLFNLKPKTA